MKKIFFTIMIIILMSAQANVFYAQDPETLGYTDYEAKVKQLYSDGLQHFLLRNFYKATLTWSEAIETGKKNNVDKAFLKKIKKEMENAYDTYSVMGSFFYKGLKYYNKRNFKKALINFKEALLINPNHSLTVKYIDLCYAKFTEKEKAEEIAKCEQLAAKYLSEGELDKVAQNRKLINLLNDTPATREQYKAIFIVIVNEQAKKFNTALSNEVIISSTLTQKEISERLAFMNILINKINNKNEKIDSMISDINEVISKGNEKGPEVLTNWKPDKPSSEMDMISKEIENIMKELRAKKKSLH